MNPIQIYDFSASSYPTDTMEQRIKYARIASGLPVRVISDAMGIHRDYYHFIEKRCNRINPHNLLRFCKTTGADPGWILYGDNQPPIVPLSGDSIGLRIREFRLSKGLTLAGFAQQAFNVPKNSSISAWESGKLIPEIRTLMRIADAFGISAVSFLNTVSSA